MGSNFIRHEPCGNCGSKDNVGVWDNGHKYCFGCGWKSSEVGSLSLQRLQKQKQEEENDDVNDSNIGLPSDCTSNLPEIVLTWLRKYGITDREIVANNLKWSDYYGTLIFPCVDSSGDLLFFQMRKFVEANPARKYDSRGNCNSLYHFIGDGVDSVVCVEDALSAIKVGRHTCAMPLWGSTISNDRIRVLSNRFKNLVIWLDHDKQKYALGRSQAARPFFFEVTTIVTERDPKEHSDEEIRKCLNLTSKMVKS